MIINNKIQFPVSDDEWTSLMAGAVSGVITLTSGSATIINDRINRSMFPLIQRISTSGTPGLIPYFNILQ